MQNEDLTYPLTDEQISGDNWRPIKDGDYVWHVPEDAAKPEDIQLGIAKFNDNGDLTIHLIERHISTPVLLSRLKLAESADTDDPVRNALPEEIKLPDWWYILYKTRDGWRPLTDGDDNLLEIAGSDLASRLHGMIVSGNYLAVRPVRSAAREITVEVSRA